ncbi:MAG: xylH [Bacteriovoracaceae bacterium]|nr:xylH [Bacteriovoracaceae bacterium]
MSAVPQPVFEAPVQEVAKSIDHRRIHWSRLVPILTLILVVIAFSFANDAFFTERNLTNLSRQVAVNCILAFGMTCIILLGAIDLSIGSLLALGSVVGGLMQVNLNWNQAGLPGALITFAVVIAVCAAVGAFTGGMVAKFKMPPFVVSLGMFVIARGLALIFSGGSKISPLSDSYRWVGTSFVPPRESLILILFVAVVATSNLLIARGSRFLPKLALVWIAAAAAISVFYSYLGIPTPVLLMAASFLGIYFLLNRTTFGRFIYAIGGNPEAARLCGIRVRLIYFLTFVLMGVLVALSAIIEGGRIDAGDPNAGNLYELDAIAAVVIGGTSLQGGVGTIGGTLLGAFLMGTMNNGMSLMNIPTNYQMVIKGMIIILAVLMDVVSKKTNR